MVNSKYLVLSLMFNPYIFVVYTLCSKISGYSILPEFIYFIWNCFFLFSVFSGFLISLVCHKKYYSDWFLNKYRLKGFDYNSIRNDCAIDVNNVVLREDFHRIFHILHSLSLYGFKYAFIVEITFAGFDNVLKTTIDCPKLFDEDTTISDFESIYQKWLDKYNGENIVKLNIRLSLSSTVNCFLTIEDCFSVFLQLKKNK